MISHKQCRRRAGTPLQLQWNKVVLIRAVTTPPIRFFCRGPHQRDVCIRQITYKLKQLLRKNKRRLSLLLISPDDLVGAAGTRRRQKMIFIYYLFFKLCKEQHLSSLMGGRREFAETSTWRKKLRGLWFLASLLLAETETVGLNE